MWIALKDRKPAFDEPVLITDGRYCAVSTLNVIGPNREDWWQAHGFGGYEWEWDFVPTHWASLPALPSTGNTGE